MNVFEEYNGNISVRFRMKLFRRHAFTVLSYKHIAVLEYSVGSIKVPNKFR